jgi:hypothetical protein
VNAGRKVCVVATPKIDDWNDWRAVKLEVVDIQAGALRFWGEGPADRGAYRAGSEMHAVGFGDGVEAPERN